jgi:hypothetical protein
MLVLVSQLLVPAGARFLSARRWEAENMPTKENPRIEMQPA